MISTESFSVLVSSCGLTFCRYAEVAALLALSSQQATKLNLCNQAQISNLSGNFGNLLLALGGYRLINFEPPLSPVSKSIISNQ